jgi:hypothetical protein
MAQRGRPRKLQAEHRSALAAIVETNPTATLEEIQGELGGERLCRRMMLDARCYVVRTVCSWRMLPSVRALAGGGVRLMTW